MSYYVTNENSVLNINNAHLKVSGNVMADVMKLGAIEFAPPGSDVGGTVNFTNVTTGVTTSSNLSVGGTLSLGTVEVVATTHTLANTTANGNVTPHTVQFSNATTGIVTTANVEVGGELAVTGNVSDLNIVSNVNMLHTSNTASIKLNSNVVTEFPRSKKLIKYPRVALTSGQSGLSGGYTQDGYTVEASSELTESGVLFAASNAFNSIQAYQSTDYAWSSAANRYGTGGLATNGTSKDTFQGIDGSWIGLTLPIAIRLDHIHLYNRAENTGHVCPAKSGIIWASNDGTSWYRILSFDNLQKTDGALNVLQVNSTNFYNRYRVQITANNPDPVKTAVMIGELEYYGTPEYDPDANGVDVKVTSYPNVPNTDWLEVYYDGQDYSADTDFAGTDGVDNKTGVSTYDATPINGVGFDTEYKAFTFDANSSQYLSSSTPVSGNYIHTISMWFKGTNLTSTGGDVLMWVGDNVDNERIEIYIENDRINYNFRNNDYIADTTFQNNRWYHLTCTYNGTQGSAGREIYVDGQRLSAYHSGNLTDLNITNSTLNVGGFSGTSTTYMFSGSIANFRLFNRALTQDEIYQLYAYQKEYFGYGDLSMTLKAGRLGIGTSEPRAALDVRGGLNLDSLLAGATGGSETEITDQNISYKVHSFTSTGTSQITVDKAGFFECLVVAGGGAGGRSNAAGGGAGGVVIQRVFVHAGTYDVVVGAGNTNGVRDPRDGNDSGGTYSNRAYSAYPIGYRGGNSSVFGLLAIGGGNGGGDDYSGIDGGSGGGCADDPNVIPGRSVQNQEGSNGYGNRGGYTRFNASAGSGGGGAGEPGYDCDPDRYLAEPNSTWLLLGRDGGSGVGSTIRTGSVQYYGGGGGGADRTTTPSDQPRAGIGGKGGGGNGGSANGTGSAGSANTGGGGGGTSSNTSNGGNGGSGIVVVRYKI